MRPPTTPPVPPFSEASFWGFFWTIPSLGMARRQPRPKRRPVELPAGFKFKPADISPELRFTGAIVSGEMLALMGIIPKPTPKRN